MVRSDYFINPPFQTLTRLMDGLLLGMRSATGVGDVESKLTKIDSSYRKKTVQAKLEAVGTWEELFTAAVESKSSA